MAEYDYDTEETSTEDMEPTAEDTARAQAIYLEQMRREESALPGGGLEAPDLSPRPAYGPAQEQAADFAAWQAGGRRPGDTTPILPLQFGERMPTSAGYMYVGKPVPAGGEAPQASAYDRGVSSGLIQPPARRLQPTDIAWTPAYDKWAAQQDYQRAIAAGTPAEKAFAEFGPALIQNPRTQFSPIAKPVQPVIRNVGGTLFKYDPATGTANALTPPKANAPSNKSLIEYLNRNLAKARTALAAATAANDKQGTSIARATVTDIERQLADLTTSTATTAPAVTAPVAAPTVAPRIGPKPVNEVIRRTKDGRRAVYDADTKKFLRYAP